MSTTAPATTRSSPADPSRTTLDEMKAAKKAGDIEFFFALQYLSDTFTQLQKAQITQIQETLEQRGLRQTPEAVVARLKDAKSQILAVLTDDQKTKLEAARKVARVEMAKSEKIVAEAANAANKVKCGSNMKQIGQALLLYANENSQKYPPDLGTLLVTQEITAEVFLCPSTGLTPPSGLGQWTREKQVAWVNANTSYAYRGAGKTNTLPKSYILLYEKLDHPDGSGINVLYGDGHVEFKPANEARQILKELGASSDGGNANPPALSGNNAAAQKSATFTSIERNGELRGLRVATITVDGAYARHFGLAERDVILQIGAFVVGDATATR